MLNEALEIWKERILVEQFQVKHGPLNVIKCLKTLSTLEHTDRFIQLVLVSFVLEFTFHVLEESFVRLIFVFLVLIVLIYSLFGPNLRDAAIFWQ